MTAMSTRSLFVSLFLFTLGAVAQTLLDVLRKEGFTEWATVLENPQNAGILSYPHNLIIYTPTNAALAQQQLSSGLSRRRLSYEEIKPELLCAPQGAVKLKRSNPTCNPDFAGPGTEVLMTLLNDPEFVNLPLGQNASIVQKNMPKGTLPIVLTGLGDTVRVISKDIPFDRGVIRPISGLFTLPRLLSETLSFLAADSVLGVLDRTGLIDDFDNRTGITFLAPEDQAFSSNLADNVLADILRRHLIVGLPAFTSDMHHGDTFRTLAGTTVTVTIQCGEVFIGGAKILSGDTIIKNGVVHIVDSLMEAPIVVTTTQVQTITETTKVVETEAVTTTQTSIETVPVPETTTTTETVTPCLQSTTSTSDTTPSEPEITSSPSSIYQPPSVTCSVLPLSPPVPTYGSSVYTPPPVLPSSSPPGTVPPPSAPVSSSTPVTSFPSSSEPPTSSGWTPPSYSSITSEYTHPPVRSPPSQSSMSSNESPPCAESTTSTSSTVYIPSSTSSEPPMYPTYPVYSPTSSTEPPEPSSTPCDSEETPTTSSGSWVVSSSTEPTEPLSTPCDSENMPPTASSSWAVYSSTTLVTSHKAISSASAPPVYEPVMTASLPPSESEAYPTSVNYGEYGAGQY